MAIAVSDSPLFSAGQQPASLNDGDPRLQYSYPTPQQVPQPYQSYRNPSASNYNHPTTLPLINVHGSHLPPPQIGLLGAISVHEREKKRKGGPGVVMTGRKRRRRLAEEGQHKLDGFQNQKLQMAQNGLMYGSQFGPGSPVPSSSGGDTPHDEGKHNLSFAPFKQGLAKSQAQQAANQGTVNRPGKSGGANGKGKKKARQDGWAGSSSLAPVDTTASISESGTHLAPPSPSYTEP